jgi:glycosyltransferase involved in cell wall biosynthesis
MEGFGLSVADAVSTGLPVVATRVGSLPEIVTEGVDGYLVDQGDSRAFVKAIEKVLNATSSKLHEGRAIRPTRFTWEKTIAETLSLYERLGSCDR